MSEKLIKILYLEQFLIGFKNNTSEYDKLLNGMRAVLGDDIVDSTIMLKLSDKCIFVESIDFTNHGYDNKIHVVKELRYILGLTLSESKSIADKLQEYPTLKWSCDHFNSNMSHDRIIDILNKKDSIEKFGISMKLNLEIKNG